MLLGINLGHRRSMFVDLLSLLSPFLQRLSFSPGTDKLLGHFHINTLIKKKIKFSSYIEIRNGAVAKSYNGLLINV
jgi:hypothetical protein